MAFGGERGVASGVERGETDGDGLGGTKGESEGGGGRFLSGNVAPMVRRLILGGIKREKKDKESSSIEGCSLRNCSSSSFFSETEKGFKIQEKKK